METMKTEPCILTCIASLLMSADLPGMTQRLLFDGQRICNPQTGSVHNTSAHWTKKCIGMQILLCAILHPDSMVRVCRAKPAPTD